MPEVKRSPLFRYGFAILMVALAATLTWLLGFQSRPFALFFAAVMVATLYGGRAAGFLAIALSALASTYLFLSPNYSFAIGLEGVIQLALFFFVSILISSLASRAQSAETGARLSEARLRTTLRSIGDAVIATDDRGRITFMNPVAQNLTGWDMKDARGRELDEVFRIINEYSREKVESPVAKVMREGVAVGLANHTLLIARDGREIPIDDSGAPIKDEAGNTTGVVLVFHNITERRLAEDNMLRLSSLVESSDDAILGKTLEGVITSWNKGAEKLYGYSAQEVVGRNISLLVPPDSTDELRRIMQKLKAGDHIEHLETIRQKKNGELINVSLSISPIKNRDGTVMGASTIARNITERKRVEAALRESEERFRVMADTAPVMIWMSDTEKLRFYFNKVWLDFTGRTTEQELGEGWAEGIHPDDLNRCLQIYRTNFDARQNFRMEYRLRRHDGQYSWVLDIGTPRHTPDGSFIGYIGSCIDITERKRIEEERLKLLSNERAARIEAEEANRLKDEFLATLSHELRTPLTAMLGWTRMLRTRQLDENTSMHALETIERNVRAQTQLIEDLLDVSRIITGKLNLDTSPVDLVPVIEAAIDSIRPAAEAKDIILEKSLDQTASPVLGDPARLQQVVWNLISNAVKFTPRGGRVGIKLHRKTSSAAITITDTGIGINPDFLPFVFDRFRQADSSSTRAHGGLGLGLAIVRHLVELHGGAVEAQSDGHERGSSFSVELPLMAFASQRTERAEAAGDGQRSAAALECPPSLEGVRVLVVDDEEDARNLIAAILEQCEATVETAADAGQAIEAVRRERPDVLISDIGMPDEDGYGLVKRLRADVDPQLKELPAVALTAYAGEDDRTRALASGFQIHLAKPVDPEALIAAVEQLVKKRESLSG